MIKIKVNGALFDLTEETLSYIRERYGESFTYELDTTEAKRILSSQTDRYFYTEAENRGGYKNMEKLSTTPNKETKTLNFSNLYMMQSGQKKKNSSRLLIL